MIKWERSYNGLYENSKTVNGVYLIRHRDGSIKPVDEVSNCYLNIYFDINDWSE